MNVQSATNPNEILEKVESVIKRDGNSHPYELKLHNGGFLGKTKTSIVWRGMKSNSI